MRHYSRAPGACPGLLTRLTRRQSCASRGAALETTRFRIAQPAAGAVSCFTKQDSDERPMTELLHPMGFAGVRRDRPPRALGAGRVRPLVALGHLLQSLLLT